MTAQGTPPAMVVVDYMQLITPESTRSGEASRAQEVAKISRGLKLIATEFNVPVIALAQFNRGAVGRKPLVTDFKDSSQIEQDASVILLLHRELAEDGSDTGPRAGYVDLIVGKNRNGQQGVEITLLFQGEYGRLRSAAPTTWTPHAVQGDAA
jgi:replicative DNA helicase